METYLSHTYWNGNGKYQHLLDEMEKAEWNEKYTAKSKATIRRYYRYFNDGDIPKGREFNFIAHDFLHVVESKLERQVNEMVLYEYERYTRNKNKQRKSKVV